MMSDTHLGLHASRRNGLNMAPCVCAMCFLCSLFLPLFVPHSFFLPIGLVFFLFLQGPFSSAGQHAIQREYELVLEVNRVTTWDEMCHSWLVSEIEDDRRRFLITVRAALVCELLVFAFFDPPV